jgi:hypothetical protein
MTGYIKFLKSLSEYQQRAEIGRLAFSERWSGFSLEEDILKDQAVVTFSETLGINARFWEFHHAIYAKEVESLNNRLRHSGYSLVITTSELPPRFRARASSDPPGTRN